MSGPNNATLPGALPAIKVPGRNTAFAPPSGLRWKAAVWTRAMLCSLVVLFCGCSSRHYLINAPLGAFGTAHRYAIRDLPTNDRNSDSLNVIVTFSGGGYRAAALSYAVLDVLNQTAINWEGGQRSLLDEVDIISAVSGGSLAAADFALNRSNFFPGFERRVLGMDLQSKTLGRFLSPEGLWTQTSRRFGRGDLLEEVLNEQLFRGATFADLPRQRPIVILNATDIHTGERFGFTQDEFDRLCSDLASFPVARAVAASMAVPVIASPITLWNHRSGCKVQAEARRPTFIDSARFLHLVDGGLADNTGVRMPLEVIASAGGLLQSTRLGGYRGVRRGVFIIVNALASPTLEEDDSPDTPGLFRQLHSAYSVPIDRSSMDGIGLLSAAVARWTQQVRQASTQSLDGLLAQALRNLPTALRISPDEIQRLKAFVRLKLERDPAWQALLDDLNAPAD
jgi:NTE family protein